MPPGGDLDEQAFPPFTGTDLEYQVILASGRDPFPSSATIAHGGNIDVGLVWGVRNYVRQEVEAYFDHLAAMAEDEAIQQQIDERRGK